MSRIQVERWKAQLLAACGREMIGALEIDDLEDIALNADGWLWIQRRGADWLRYCEIGEHRAYEIVTSVAAVKGVDVNGSSPVLETTFPLDGSRFTAVVPPVTERAVFSLRKHSRERRQVFHYESSGVVTDAGDARNAFVARHSFADQWRAKPHGDILRAAIEARKNVVIAGPPGSGKTRLADTLCNEIAALTPEDRVVYIEDVPEMDCAVPNVVGLLTNDTVDLLKCVRTAMRLRASRIIVGEVRGAEAHPLLKAWMTGHPGGIATVHADDAEGALKRLEALIGEATDTPAQDLIAQAVDLIVYIEADKRVTAGRKVKQIMAVTGWSGKYEVTNL